MGGAYFYYGNFFLFFSVFFMVFQVRNAQRSGAIGVIIYGEFDSLVFLSLPLYTYFYLSFYF